MLIEKRARKPAPDETIKIEAEECSEARAAASPLGPYQTAENELLECPAAKLDSGLGSHFCFLFDLDDFCFATAVCLLPFLPLFFSVPGACRCWAADLRVLG